MEGMDMQKLNFLISIILAFGLCFLGCQNSINPSESSESEQSGMEVLTCTNGNGNGDGDGCTLTPGYWKTHSDYGPAPYDETWAEIGGEIPPCEENTPFFNSGKSYPSSEYPKSLGRCRNNPQLDTHNQNSFSL